MLRSNMSITKWQVHSLLKIAKKSVEEMGMFRKKISVILSQGLQTKFSFLIIWQGLVLIFGC